MKNPIKLLNVVFFALFLLTYSTNAWVYPEHREIMIETIFKLSGERKIILDRLWQEARIGHEGRLSLFPADTSLGINPDNLDYAAWPGIAGDHSCSPDILLYNVLQTDWIMDVAHITAKFWDNMQSAERRDQISNYLRDQDIELQRADPYYATRAGSNNAHFLLARPTPYTSGKEYAALCFTEGNDINGLGIYVIFHLKALNKINYLFHNPDIDTDLRRKIILSALADEAFAIHFLQDAFASGHVAGTWGNVAIRKGSHDYYNENGIEISTWNNKAFVILGDAYMRDVDADTASNCALKSLNQFIDAYQNKLNIDYIQYDIAELSAADTFNVCKNNIMPNIENNATYSPYLVDVLLDTPIPALTEGYGQLPRFRAEIGPFIGMMTGAEFNTMYGGYGADQEQIGHSGSLDIAARFGYGMEGVINESSDGMIFLDAGIRVTSSSTSTFCDTEECHQLNQFTSVIPGRNALFGRLRMPFWAIPGDLIVALPLVGILWPDTYASMAVVAANGGVIPWQAVMATSFGSFQFILGREITCTLYGYVGDNEKILIPMPISSPDSDEFELALISTRALAFEFPIVEYRPFRTFSQEQSTSLRFQFYGGVDIPRESEVLTPEGTALPSLKSIWSIGLRMNFDWRWYLN